MALRVLVVDDSSLFQHMLKEALKGVPEVEIVGVASNGRMAITGIQALKPDLVTLDVEMPELDGIGTLTEIRQKKLEVGVIMVSSLTQHGSMMTVKALELGAFHFVSKPSGGNAQESVELLRNSLTPLIQAFSKTKSLRDSLRAAQQNLSQKTAPTEVKVMGAIPPQAAQEVKPQQKLTGPLQTPELVLIGTSTGGPEALGQLLPKLPADLGVPVLIVQHMPPLFTKCLADSLSAKCLLKVREAQDGDVLEAGMVYIAPGGKQMKLMNATGNRKMIRITDDPPEKSCKPSVDYLFRSVAQQFPGKAMAVIMTGMGNDGTLGLQLLKKDNAFTIAQDQASCVVFGMPREAIQAGVVDQVLPLDAIALEITRSVRRFRA